LREVILAREFGHGSLTIGEYDRDIAGGLEQRDGGRDVAVRRYHEARTTHRRRLIAASLARFGIRRRDFDRNHGRRNTLGEVGQFSQILRVRSLRSENAKGKGNPKKNAMQY